MLFESESSSSEEEDIEQNIYILCHQIDMRRAPIRIQNFFEFIIPNFSNQEFQSHFRITRQTFENLVVKLSPFLEKEEGVGGKSRIPVERQILSSLWLLSTPDSYRSVGSRFNMGKSSLFVCFVRVITALNQISAEIIKWPSRQEREIIKNSFREIANLPGVVGAIDGTYVPIKAPSEHPEIYINRKCFHAITLQAVCIPSLAFTDCFTGYPSSVSDIRIFRNSDIYTRILANINEYFIDGEYIIGDKAYPVRDWCIPPFIERGLLTARRTRFNIVHAKTRQVVERAFALLFGRFRRLRYLDMNRIDLIPATIIAACVLHNICLMNPDELLMEYINEGLPMMNNGDDEERMWAGENANAGEIRRNNLTENL